VRCPRRERWNSRRASSTTSATFDSAEIERRTGFEARTTVLGHVLRGGSPTAYDRVIATRFGIEAIDAVHEGDFGVMVALHGTNVVRVPIEEGVERLKTVDEKLYNTAAVFFG